MKVKKLLKLWQEYLKCIDKENTEAVAVAEAHPYANGIVPEPCWAHESFEGFINYLTKNSK